MQLCIIVSIGVGEYENLVSSFTHVTSAASFAISQSWSLWNYDKSTSL